ncbi:hypothetical protein Tco_1573944, partial [Tanacetum coccineum]
SNSSHRLDHEVHSIHSFELSGDHQRSQGHNCNALRPSRPCAQVGSQDSNQGNDRNQNGDAVNDNIQGDARNVIMNNDRMGCTYKEFLAFNPKECDGKGGVIVYTRWIKKMESV